MKGRGDVEITGRGNDCAAQTAIVGSDGAGAGAGAGNVIISIDVKGSDGIRARELLNAKLVKSVGLNANCIRFLELLSEEFK